MAIRIDSKGNLLAVDSQSSLVDDVSVCVCDEESEDGAKCDSNTEDFMSAEEEEELKNAERKDSGVSLPNKFQSDISLSEQCFKTQDELSILKKSGSMLLSSEGALECAAMLAEGIKTLGKTQEENWKRMNDLISKKDNLIKEMADLVTTFKKKMPTSNASCKGNDEQKLTLCTSCKTLFEDTLIPERHANEFWPQNSVDLTDNLYCRDVSKRTGNDSNVLCECSTQGNFSNEKEIIFITEINEMPILEVPIGYDDDKND